MDPDEAAGRDFSRVDATAGPRGDAIRARFLFRLSVGLTVLGLAVIAAAFFATQWQPDAFTLAQVETVLVLASWICPVLGLLTFGLARRMSSEPETLARVALWANAGLLVVAGVFSVSTWG